MGLCIYFGWVYILTSTPSNMVRHVDTTFQIQLNQPEYFTQAPAGPL